MITREIMYDSFEVYEVIMTHAATKVPISIIIGRGALNYRHRLPVMQCQDFHSTYREDSIQRLGFFHGNFIENVEKLRNPLWIENFNGKL